MKIDWTLQENGVDTRLKKRIEESMMAAVGKACLVVEDTAKQLCPSSTGTLRSSIKSEVVKEDGIIVGYVGSPLEYAPYVEFGTGLFAAGGNGRWDVPWCYYSEEYNQFIWTNGQHPHPYLIPALNQNKDKINKILREGIK